MGEIIVFGAVALMMIAALLYQQRVFMAALKDVAMRQAVLTHPEPERAAAAQEMLRTTEAPLKEPVSKPKPIGLRLENGDVLELLSPQAQLLLDTLPQEKLAYDDDADDEAKAE